MDKMEEIKVYYAEHKNGDMHRDHLDRSSLYPVRLRTLDAAAVAETLAEGGKAGR